MTFPVCWQKVNEVAQQIHQSCMTQVVVFFEQKDTAGKNWRCVASGNPSLPALDRIVRRARTMSLSKFRASRSIDQGPWHLKDTCSDFVASHPLATDGDYYCPRPRIPRTRRAGLLKYFLKLLYTRSGALVVPTWDSQHGRR